LLPRLDSNQQPFD